jgi:hypothetical protein
VSRPTAILAALALAAGLVACGGDDEVSNEDLLTASGFETALEAVEGEAGDDAAALRVQVTAAGAEFRLLTEDGATAYAYSGGELAEVQVAVIAGSLEGEEFPLSDVDPGAIDEIADGISDKLGDDAALTALSLETAGLDGVPRWTVSAQAPDGSGEVFVAEPDGSELRPAGDGPRADG